MVYLGSTTKLDEITFTANNMLDYPIQNSFNSYLNSTIKNDNMLYKSIVYSLTIPLFFLTAAGNGVILITIKFQARLLSSNSNYFILSLAFADFFVGVAIMPIMIIFTAHNAKWIYSQTLCDSWMAFDFLCSSASFLTLSAMSVERYKMLTTSYIHIKNSSKLRIIVFIFLSWCLPILTWIPVIIGYRLKEGSINTGECMLPANKYVILLLCVFLYHIPLICMVTFYTKLIIHIKKSSVNQLDFSSNKKQQNNNSNHLNCMRYQASLNSNRNSLCRNSLYNEKSVTNNYYYSNNNNNIEEDDIRNENSLVVESKGNRRYSASNTNNANRGSLKYNRKFIHKSNSFSANNNRNAYGQENCYLFYSRSSSSKSQISNSIKSKLSFILPCCFRTAASTSPVKNKTRKSSNSNLAMKSVQNRQIKKKKSTTKISENFKNFNKFQLIQQQHQLKQQQDQFQQNQMRRISLKDGALVSVLPDDGLLKNRKFSLNINLRAEFDSKSETFMYTKQNFDNLIKLPQNSNNNTVVNTNNNEAVNDDLKNDAALKRYDSTKPKENKKSIFSNSSTKNKEPIVFYENSDYHNLRLKRNRKAARMLGLLVAAFSICWLPFTIFYPLSQFYPKLLPDYANLVIWWLGYSNSAINPFLYVYSNKNIRRSVRILFFKRLWNAFTGKKVNKNFRSDSLKNNIANSNYPAKLSYRKPYYKSFRLTNNIF